MTKKLIIPVCFLWVGLLIAISFVEAPLKFQAPGISIKLGLGIGKLVFAVINKIELTFLILIIFSIITKEKRMSLGIILVSLIAAILLFQSLYLLPALDQRAELILKDRIVPSTFHHSLYIILECIKVLLLVATGFNYLLKLNYNTENKLIKN